MAVSLTPKENLSYRTVKLETTTAAAQTNITGGAVTVYSILVDNAATAVTYVKLHDGTFSTTDAVGTTAPTCIFRVPAQTKKTINIPSGLAFSTALNVWCEKNAGTAGTDAPTGGTVTIYFTTGV